MATFHFVEGDTAPVDFTLSADGSAYDLTGASVELLLWDKNENAISSPGTVAVTDAESGTIRVTLSVTLRESLSRYSARFRVTPPGSSFPNKEPDIWLVRKP